MGKTATILLAALIALSGATASAGEGSGSFSGVNGHQATGQVAVVRTADGWEVRLEDSFSFDGAPDPWVGFGRSGSFVPATDFHRLRSNTGAQVYKVPADIDAGAYDEVYIWCRRYSVPLGVARITD
ncbi:MAG: DM13 domain-containing protein [Proteobacteria bacterium]|nr:DM13 domain-containing protein [Pseudomonadota bacterium]MCH8952694.1 DM13 domain-containing protein [Pseudomonadota bacterium]